VTQPLVRKAFIVHLVFYNFSVRLVLQYKECIEYRATIEFQVPQPLVRQSLFIALVEFDTLLLPFWFIDYFILFYF
jgi:hypothetical protein